MNNEVCWLHRRYKSTWQFQWSAIHNAFIYKSRFGNIYAILEGYRVGKPLWVGRFADGVWFTVEKELRAREIEFENGARYIFGD